MNLKQLRTFIRIAELGSLSKASDRLRIAQPALSRQMKQLQDDIGVPLFTRHRRGMQLTEAGEALRARILGPLRQLEQARDDVRSAAGTPSGHVVLGVLPTVSVVLARKLACRVYTELPGVSLRIVEGYTGHQVDWLQRGEVDAAILYGSEGGLHLPAEELLIEDLVVVGPADSDLNSKTPVRVSEFCALPLLLPSALHGLRVLLESAAAKARSKLVVRIEADSFRVLTDLVENGLGFTALPLSSIAQEIEQGRLKYAPLVQPQVTRRLILGTAQGPLARATQMVIKLARREIAELVRRGIWRARLQFTPPRS
jgi:LysR family transcriptional regulator, nitrogen assimilation regulatory protein